MILSYIWLYGKIKAIYRVWTVFDIEHVFYIVFFDKNLYKLLKKAFEPQKYEVKNKKLNIFLIAGKNDPVIQSEQKFKNLEQFLNKLGYKNIKSKLYPDLRHEILNEKEYEQIYEDVLEFYYSARSFITVSELYSNKSIKSSQNTM